MVFLEEHAQVVAAETRLDGRFLHFLAAAGGPCASHRHNGPRGRRETDSSDPEGLNRAITYLTK
jgi:hypothetical protein